MRRRGGTLPSRSARVDCVGGVPRSRLLFACRSIERACSTVGDSQLFATAGLLAAVHLRTTGVVGAVRRMFRELRRHTGPPDPGRSRPVQESAATLWPGPDWAGRGPGHRLRRSLGLRKRPPDACRAVISNVASVMSGCCVRRWPGIRAGIGVSRGGTPAGFRSWLGSLESASSMRSWLTRRRTWCAGHRCRPSHLRRFSGTCSSRYYSPRLGCRPTTTTSP